jgi:hypothetical protein
MNLKKQTNRNVPAVGNCTTATKQCCPNCGYELVKEAKVIQLIRVSLNDIEKTGMPECRSENYHSFLDGTQEKRERSPIWIQKTRGFCRN